MKKIVILQSNYIPWKGYFDLVGIADEFIIYDEVQYTKNDWRNRNQILSSSGQKTWLTIPVKYKFSERPTISSIKVSNSDWAKTHIDALAKCYRGARNFETTMAWVETVYKQVESEDFLSKINLHFLKETSKFLGLKHHFSSSNEYLSREMLESIGKTERLALICEKALADTYISGPAARNYIEESAFIDRKIKLIYCDYSHYREYNQFDHFKDHFVTIFDLLFHEGKDAKNYLKGPKIINHE